MTYCDKSRFAMFCEDDLCAECSPHMTPDDELKILQHRLDSIDFSVFDGNSIIQDGAPIYGVGLGELASKKD